MGLFMARISPVDFCTEGEKNSWSFPAYRTNAPQFSEARA
jgi:hypothetical protein